MEDKYLEQVKKQTYWTKLTALFMGGVFLVAVITSALLIPRALTIMTETETALTEANESIENLEAITEQLSQIDFETLVSDTQTLINQSSTGIADAMDKLDAIDIDNLNQAIESLSRVVTPLAKLFGGGKS